MDFNWNELTIPVQEDFEAYESINPAEAYRRQAVAINLSAPLLAELEEIEEELDRVSNLEKELRSRILAQNMPVPSSSTRTNDLVDGFILSKSREFTKEDGEVIDVSSTLLDLGKKKANLETKKKITERRIRSIESMAEKCQSIMNWAKLQARIEFGKI